MYDRRIANQVHRQPMASLPEASNVAGIEHSLIICIVPLLFYFIVQTLHLASDSVLI
jgi:hypothetical protein